MGVISPRKDLELKFLFFCVGLMPYVPSFSSPQSILFVFAFTIYAIQAIYINGHNFRIDHTGIIVFLLCVVFLPSMTIVSAILGNAASAAFRVAVPFFFIIVYIFFAQDRRTSIERVPHLIILSGAVWVANIVLKYPSDVIAAMTGSLARLTFVSSEMLVPLGLAGFILTIYDRRLHGLLQFSLAFIFFGMILLSGYRSQVLLAIAVFIFANRNIMIAKNFISIAVLLICVLMYLSLNQTYLEMMLSRGIYSSGDLVRLLEIDFAQSVFEKNIVFGGGFGVQVPLALTRPGMSLEAIDQQYVPYIHNFLFYILMVSGLFGLSFFILLFFPAFIISIRCYLKGSMSREIESAVTCLITILVYFQISASFRQIQMWIILCALLAYIIQHARQKKVYEVA